MTKKRKIQKKKMGSSIDAFLQEEGIFEAAQAQAVREVAAWQLDQTTKKQKASKKRTAVPHKN
jgi:predicted dinucleotide-utilizing enzyme